MPIGAVRGLIEANQDNPDLTMVHHRDKPATGGPSPAEEAQKHMQHLQNQFDSSTGHMKQFYANQINQLQSYLDNADVQDVAEEKLNKRAVDTRGTGDVILKLKKAHKDLGINVEE